METRSNHVLVGSVVLILIAVTALFLVWIARWAAGSDKRNTTSSSSNRSTGSPRVGRAVLGRAVRADQGDQAAAQSIAVRARAHLRRRDRPRRPGRTTATIQGSFTGTRTVQLDGAQKGAPPMSPNSTRLPIAPTACRSSPPSRVGPGRAAQLRAELLERISTLTERLTEVLSDKNQNSIHRHPRQYRPPHRRLADRGPRSPRRWPPTRVDDAAGGRCRRADRQTRRHDQQLLDQQESARSTKDLARDRAVRASERMDTLSERARSPTRGLACRPSQADRARRSDRWCTTCRHGRRR